MALTKQDLAAIKGIVDDAVDTLASTTAKQTAHFDQKFASHDKRFEQIDERFEQIDQRLDKIEGEVMLTNKILHQHSGDIVELKAKAHIH